MRPVERLRGAVEYRHVGFGYRKDGTVLSDVNLTVRPGERIALVGPSGAGKTSLLKLLMRFYDVRSGAVLVDGHDVRELPLDFLRGQIGLVQQEPFLFNGTVRQNIVYSDLSAGHERVEAAARAARAHDFITRLPDGYDSWIGERGVKLSVGQKQRVSIARVLLKDPPIVIFDEESGACGSPSIRRFARIATTSLTCLGTMLSSIEPPGLPPQPPPPMLPKPVRGHSRPCVSCVFLPNQRAL